MMLDLRLPDGDGLSLCRDLRASGITTANKGNETSMFVNGFTLGLELNR